MKPLTRAGAPANQPAEWLELLPEMLKPAKPPTMKQFYDALDAVSLSRQQGHINEAEADLLIRHLCSVFVANEVAGLFQSLSDNPFGENQDNRNSWEDDWLSGLNRW